MKNNSIFKWPLVLILSLFIFTVFYLNLSQKGLFKVEVKLTENEIEWLQNHKEIRVAPAPFWPPIDIFPEGGSYSGISKDYLDIIENSLNIKFKPIKYVDMPSILNDIIAKKLDVSTASAPTPERYEYMRFTEAYIDVSVVIVAKNSFNEAVNEKSLSLYKVAIGNQFAAHDYLKRKYPEMVFIPKPNDYGVLEALIFNEADVAVIDVADASTIIEEKKYSQLKVVGRIDYEYTASFGIRSDYEPLVSSMNKVLQNIPKSKKNAIQERWIRINTTPFYMETKYQLGLGIFLITLITIGFWNISLRQQVNKRTAEIVKMNEELEYRVEERTTELEEVNHELDMHIDQLMTTQKQLVEAEKFASLGRLVSGVAHKLNTPIGNIFTSISYQENLLNQFKDAFFNQTLTKETVDDFIKDNTAILKSYTNNVEKLIKTINDFKRLQFPEIDHEQKALFNLSDLLFKVVSDIISDKKDYIKVVVDCEQSLLVESYYHDLELILTVLIENAYRHGFKDLESGQIKLTATKIENRLIMTIWDDGNIIPSDKLQEVFTPFFTTDLQHSSGLGLCVVYNLIHNKFNGNITCESSTKIGTQFTLHLPI